MEGRVEGPGRDPALLADRRLVCGALRPCVSEQSDRYAAILELAHADVAAAPWRHGAGAVRRDWKHFRPSDGAAPALCRRRPRYAVSARFAKSFSADAERLRFEARPGAGGRL